MRLAFALFNYYPNSGLARDCLRVAQCAHQHGHQVTLFTRRWQGPTPTVIEVRELASGGMTNHGQANAFYRALQKQLAREQYDAVIGFNRMPGLDIYFAADDCFIAKHTLRPFWYRLTPRYRRFAAFERAVCSTRSGTQILYLSDNQRSDFRCFHLTPDHRLHQLPPNLDPGFDSAPVDDGTRRRYRAAFEINDEQLTVLMVGSGFRTKGVDRAVAAIAALPATLRDRSQLLIAGDGDDGPYRQLADRLHVGAHIRFLGARDDVAKLLKAADLLLHPARREAGGAVLLEALATGTPILTLSVCGHATHVARAGAGVVLPEPYRQLDLNRALEHMLSCDRQRWRDNARTYAGATPLAGMADYAVQKIVALGAAPGVPAHNNAAIYLSETLRAHITPDFTAILNTPGRIYRAAHARRTTRFTCANGVYFIKSHFGAGWGEICKNWINLRRPVLGAENEWYALHRLPKLGIPVVTPAGYGRRGSNPARRQSFVITEELNAVSLERVLHHWLQNPARGPEAHRFKRRLIVALARIARQLHEGGLNHQDFYICHFWVEWPGFPEQPPPVAVKVYLLDLHRVQQRRTTPRRWAIKDLAGLYFSVLALHPTTGTCLRFISHYRQQELRKVLAEERDFWRSVAERAHRLRQRAPRQTNDDTTTDVRAG